MKKKEEIMITITEDYVSFDIAKLLKEKGFQGYSIITEYDENAANKYIKELKENHLSYSSDDPKLKEFYYTKPTLQMAMKWLREVHNKHCDTGYDIDLKWFFQIIDLKEVVEYDYPGTKYYHSENGTGFNSYEEACEAAIKYCLENLI